MKGEDFGGPLQRKIATTPEDLVYFVPNPGTIFTFKGTIYKTLKSSVGSCDGCDFDIDSIDSNGDYNEVSTCCLHSPDCSHGVIFVEWEGLSNGME